jgi:amino acid adenylation domain-containing protein
MEFLHSLWLSRVDSRASAIAVQDSTGTYTYEQLEKRSAEWFELLKSKGVCVGHRIMFVADTSFEAIAALIGCSMAGGFFSVVSPEVPKSRRDGIQIEFLPNIVIEDEINTGYSCEELSIFGRFKLKVEITAADTNSKTVTRLTSMSPAYIVFTSGSTGRPKGIVMSHQAVVSFWQGLIEHASLRDDMRYASLSPLQFDFSLLDIGLCLGSGATLLLPSRALLRKPEQMIQQLVDWETTHFSGVPTIWKLIFQSAQHAVQRLTKLEWIAFAGEHFPRELMCSIGDILSNVVFYNIYGQSESIACTFQVIDSQIFRKNSSHLPVGVGHSSMEMLLLDDHGKLVTTAHQTGELHLRGRPLFSGYWMNPDETKRRLIQNPLHDDYVDMVFRSGDICYFDEAGLFYFIGRQDNQIKVNGNRVELEEIEASLSRFPGVLNNCVLAVNDGQSMSLHAAIVVPKEPFQEKEIELRRFLSSGLPAYMLPKNYHFLESIPISANGKNDRRQLSELLGLTGVTQ